MFQTFLDLSPTAAQLILKALDLESAAGVIDLTDYIIIKILLKWEAALHRIAHVPELFDEDLPRTFVLAHLSSPYRQNCHRYNSHDKKHQRTSDTGGVGFGHCAQEILGQ